MLQKMANVPCGAVTPYSGFQRHPKSRRSGAVSTSQSPKSKQFSFARFCCMWNSKPLYASDLEPYTSFELLCIPGRLHSLRWTSAQWQPRRWAVLECVSDLEGCSGNAGSCNSQPCMLWIPILAQVIDAARIFSTSCTWHGQPGLQAGKLKATMAQLQVPRFFD